VEEEKISITRQRRCKHVSATTEANATMEQLLEKKCNNRRTVGGVVFYAVHPEAIYWGPKWSFSQWLTVEAVSESAGSQC
jgi:hypothetical protein